MAKFRIRSNREFRLYATNTTLGWRVIRHRTAEVGENKVAGLWRHVYEPVSLMHVGYQPLGADRLTDEDLNLMEQSSAYITADEMELIAGVAFRGSRSMTFGMNEVARTERITRGLAPEDKASAPSPSSACGTRWAPPKATSCACGRSQLGCSKWSKSYACERLVIDHQRRRCGIAVAAHLLIASGYYGRLTQKVEDHDDRLGTAEAQLRDHETSSARGAHSLPRRR